MKKVLLFGVALFFVAGLSSCTKDWTCECTISGVKTEAVIEDRNKKDAQEACDGLETTAKIIDATANCTLKAK